LTITYNCLNLPSKFAFAGNNSIELIYDGSGAKLRKTVKTNGVVTLLQDYLGGIELRNSKFEAIHNEEGRAINVSATGQDWKYEYSLKDHLGNTRVSFRDKNGNGIIENQTEVLSETHYYPFGMAMNGAWLNDAASSKTKYLYNGKELNDEFGLNLNDYGARWYDAAVGRFIQVDDYADLFPLNSWSPYAYVRNNPIKKIDPTGNWDIDVHVTSGDRKSDSYGIAVLKDMYGNEVYSFTVKVLGTHRARLKTDGDTPLGTYDIPNKNPWIYGGDRGAYGPNQRLSLNAKSGEILLSGRSLIRVHGGRQEKQGKNGTWNAINPPELKSTQGCIRCYDSDIISLKDAIDRLESANSQEYGGVLNVIDDKDSYILGKGGKTRSFNASDNQSKQFENGSKPVIQNAPNDGFDFNHFYNMFMQQSNQENSKPSKEPERA
jgi:RHS repeat-associated protein